MDKFKLYQECIAHSVEQLNNANAQLLNYVSKVMDIKVEYITQKIVGKTFSFDDLINRRDYRYERYEKCQYKAVFVESTIKDYNFSDNVLSEDPRFNTLASIEVHFMRDPNVLLKDKKKLTDKERSLLNRMLWYWEIKDGTRPRYNLSEKRPEALNDELADLKHNLSVAISLFWEYNLDDILRDTFITRGIKAEIPLINSYDRTE